MAGSNDPPAPTTGSAGARRVKYGMNVLVAVAAVIAIVVIVNIIAFNRLFTVRYDFTAGSRYSLADQTRLVLGDLEHDYRIVTILSSSNVYYEQATDLIDEYARLSGRVTVEHLSPTSGRLATFYDDLQARYGEEIAPVRSAIERGRRTLGDLREAFREQAEQMAPLLDDASPLRNEQRDFVQAVAQAMSRFDRGFDQQDEQLTRALDRDLPAYGEVGQNIRTRLEEVDQGVLEVAADRFEQYSRQASLAGPVAETLLRLVDRLRATRAMLEGPIEELTQTVDAMEGYNRLRSQIEMRDVVVVVGDSEVRVIPLDDMFQNPDREEIARLQEQGLQPELRFLGEERLTGALIAMELASPPLAVFIGSGEQQALGPRGDYENVAERLRTLNFEVTSWNPSGGQRNPMTGQQTPAGPPPTPAPGQRAVWIFTPTINTNMFNPGASGGAQEVINLLATRMELGDAALIMVGPNPGASFGMPDETRALLEGWGVTPQRDRVLLQEVIRADRTRGVTTQLSIERWPDDLPVTAAIASMPGVVVTGVPLTLTRPEAPAGPGGAETEQGGSAPQTWPLIRVSQEGLFVHRDFNDPNPARTDENAISDAVLAAAAQRGDQRVVVIGDAAWASNSVTSYGLLGPGTAELTGAAFPGNAELFVNSVLWLSHLDQLIAASARVQDIRRISELSPGELSGMRWGLTLGMPALIAVIGLGVWFSRRR